MKLQGKTVWITGASSGIGAALAHELAARGAKVALTARRAEPLFALAQELQRQNAQAVALPGDVTSLTEMQQAAHAAEQGLGNVDIAVANAGIDALTQPETFDSAEYERIMDTNFVGMLHCIEAVLPAMLARASGIIVGVASLAGYRGLPRAAAYGASKAAMIYFLESIRFHLRPRGIKVVIVNPGFVKTPMTDKNDFQMPFRIEAQRAARYICNGLERGKQKICFPPPLCALMETARVLPFPLYEFVAERVWRRLDHKP